MNTPQDKYTRAAARVADLKKFYGRLIKFAVFGIFFIGFSYFIGSMGSGWVYLVLVFWALGLIIEGFKLFGPNLIFGRGWESRVIAKEMRKEDDTRTLF